VDQVRSTPADQRSTQVRLDYPVCPHVEDIELAYWYAEHPEVICARCWLEAHGRGIWESEAGGVDKSSRRGGTPRNVSHCEVMA